MEGPRGGPRSTKERAMNLGEAYMDMLKKPASQWSSARAWKELADLGTELLGASGSVGAAVSVLWEIRRRRGMDNLRGVHSEDHEGRVPEEVLAYLREVAEQGVEMRYREERRRQRSKPHPPAMKALAKVFVSVWKDIRKARILVAWDRGQPEFGNTSSAPLNAVEKFEVDGTLSEEIRVIHDQTGQNEGCAKEDHPPANQPVHAQLARQILWCKCKYPGLRVLLAKRDIDGAFRLLWVAPGDAEMFATDLPFDAEAMNSAGEIARAKEEEQPPPGGGAQEGPEAYAELQGAMLTLIFLVLSFGWRGSPGEWMVWAWATLWYHRSFKPNEPEVEGPEAFRGP